MCRQIDNDLRRRAGRVVRHAVFRLGNLPQVGVAPELTIFFDIVLKSADQLGPALLGQHFKSFLLLGFLGRIASTGLQAALKLFFYPAH